MNFDKSELWFVGLIVGGFIVVPCVLLAIVGIVDALGGC